MADTDPRLFPALPNTGSSISSDDKSWIMKEVESGLRNHRPRLAAAIENQAFYDLESDRYQPRREAETEFDFAGRPRRQEQPWRQMSRLAAAKHCRLWRRPNR